MKLFSPSRNLRISVYACCVCLLALPIISFADSSDQNIQADQFNYYCNSLRSYGNPEIVTCPEGWIKVPINSNGSPRNALTAPTSTQPIAQLPDTSTQQNQNNITPPLPNEGQTEQKNLQSKADTQTPDQSKPLPPAKTSESIQTNSPASDDDIGFGIGMSVWFVIFVLALIKRYTLYLSGIQWFFMSLFLCIGGWSLRNIVGVIPSNMVAMFGLLTFLYSIFRILLDALFNLEALGVRKMSANFNNAYSRSRRKCKWEYKKGEYYCNDELASRDAFIKAIEKSRNYFTGAIVSIDYLLEDEEATKFTNLCRGFSDLVSCSSKEFELSAKKLNVGERKYHSGANEIVSTQKLKVGFGLPSKFRSNIQVPMFQTRSFTYAFFPELILVTGKKHRVAVFPYENTLINIQDENISVSDVPKDATVTGHTWKYVNQNGDPDRRFKDNKKLSNVSYDAIDFTFYDAPDDEYYLSLHVLFSKKGCTSRFQNAFNNIKNTDSSASCNSDNDNGETDPLFERAVAIVLETRRASISLVQRHLQIGYERAARLIEKMEHAGMVSAMQPDGTREVLIDEINSSHNHQGGHDDEHDTPIDEADLVDWPDVLGIESTATLEDIKKAYRLRMSEYHPDKVAGLGKELRDLANKKAQEINQAYEHACQLKSQ